ncbi:MAG TPA: alpha/beta-type small acid-soluble spore protein [Firmicutes bacterium]|nr:alpha/beta-type small acid-soluble spore protein [Bacillota bacterium]
MAEGQRTNQVLVPQARQALDQWRNEIASELGINPPGGYFGDVPARYCGAIGGHMVKRMIQMAEQSLSSGAGFGTLTATPGTTGGTTAGRTPTR